MKEKEGLEALFSTESSSWVLKIPLRLNCSSPCGDPTVSKGSSWRSPVGSGGGGGAWGVGGGFGGRVGGRRWLFYANGRIWSLQHSPSLGELIQLTFYCFGKKQISHTHDVILQIPTVRMWIIVLGTSRKNLRIIQRLTNPDDNFTDISLGKIWNLIIST